MTLFLLNCGDTRMNGAQLSHSLRPNRANGPKRNMKELSYTPFIIPPPRNRRLPLWCNLLFADEKKAWWRQSNMILSADILALYFSHYHLVLNWISCQCICESVGLQVLEVAQPRWPLIPISVVVSFILAKNVCFPLHRFCVWKCDCWTNTEAFWIFHSSCLRERAELMLAREGWPLQNLLSPFFIFPLFYSSDAMVEVEASRNRQALHTWAPSPFAVKSLLPCLKSSQERR